MFKPLAFASAIALAGAPAMAESGVYVNPEYNAGFTGSQFAGSTLELHVGYEEGPWYIQAGPALANDGSDSEWGMSAKTGLSGSVSEKMDLTPRSATPSSRQMLVTESSWARSIASERLN